MKHLAIPILEFVLLQPAHKLPVVFTLEECPLPECSEEPSDVLQEVLRLRDEGLIEAHVIRGVTGKPSKAEIRYVTLGGKIFLDNRNMRGKENKKDGVSPWFVAGLVILGALILGSFFGHFSKASLFHRENLTPKPSPTEIPLATPTPIPSPSLSPEASPTPSPIATPIPVSSPSSTPSPAAVVSPDPSGKSKNQLPRVHSLHESW
jgi:hypothetical protein